jgi:hypothetical protein
MLKDNKLCMWKSYKNYINTSQLLNIRKSTTILFICRYLTVIVCYNASAMQKLQKMITQADLAN